MILRRFGAAIRSQDWFTVFVEFSLIVVGLLCALQIDNWNQLRKVEALSGKSWALSRKLENYVWGERDDRAYEVDLKGYGRTFPHPYGEAAHPLFATRVLVSPQGDYLTMDFARTLLDAEQLEAVHAQFKGLHYGQQDQ